MRCIISIRMNVGIIGEIKEDMIKGMIRGIREEVEEAEDMISEVLVIRETRGLRTTIAGIRKRSGMNPKGIREEEEEVMIREILVVIKVITVGMIRTFQKATTRISLTRGSRIIVTLSRLRGGI